MGDFKVASFPRRDHPVGVRWYCEYGISDRELEVTMSERGLTVDHTTIYRWVQQYAPEMEKRLKRYLRSSLHRSLGVDETYAKVKDQWVYLYRAVDRRGETIDFYLSPTRRAKATKRPLGPIAFAVS